jgi:L-fucose isomerase-like protein
MMGFGPTYSGRLVKGPRPFVLVRTEDETGVSGTGIVAEGVEFEDGTVALRWRGKWPTSVVFHERGIDAVRAVHGHGGKTSVVWTD